MQTVTSSNKFQDIPLKNCDTCVSDPFYINDEDLSFQDLSEWLDEQNERTHGKDDVIGASFGDSEAPKARTSTSNALEYGGNLKRLNKSENIMKQKRSLSDSSFGSECRAEYVPSTTISDDGIEVDECLSADFDLDPLDLFDGLDECDFTMNKDSRKRSSSQSEYVSLPPHKRARKQCTGYFSDSDSSLSGDMSLCCPVHVQRTEPEQSHSSKSVTEQNEYDDVMNNLTVSMKRSELSRAQVLENAIEHLSSESSTSNAHWSVSTISPSPSAMQSLGDLLAGKRLYLTSGLEESRKQLQKYLSLMSPSQLF